MARPLKVDTSRYVPLVAEATRAYAADSSYAVAMARSATNILNKRRAYAARREASEAALPAAS